MNCPSLDSRVQVGATMLIPSGVSGNHLFVVVLSGKIIGGKECLVLACLCTIRHSKYDNTCIIKAGEHPFAVSDSYISYAHCRLDPVSEIIERLDAQTFKARDDHMSPELIERIKSGLAIPGGRTPRFIKMDWEL